MVLWEMAQTSALVESATLAETIQQEFNALLGTNDRGVRQAPFAVLEGAQMPAVLVECAYLSNLGAEAKLNTKSYQRKIADGIYEGIKRYDEKKGI